MDPNLPPSDVSDTLRTYRGTQQGQILQVLHSDEAFPRTRYTTMSFRLVEELEEEGPLPPSLQEGSARLVRGSDWRLESHFVQVSNSLSDGSPDQGYDLLGLRLVEEE